MQNNEQKKYTRQNSAKKEEKKNRGKLLTESDNVECYCIPLYKVSEKQTVVMCVWYRL